jgi:hypothetical protein
VQFFCFHNMMNVSGGIRDQVTFNVCRIIDLVDVCGWITPLLLTNFYALQSSIYSVIHKDGLNFLSVYFKIRTSDKYDVNYI